MERRKEGGKTDAEGRKKLLEDEVKNWLPADSEVALSNVPNWDEIETHLATEFSISCPLAVGAGKRWIVPVHLFQVNEKPRFPASERVNSISFDYLSRELYHAILAIELPPEISPDLYRVVVPVSNG
jgi:hypothetical protein